MIDYTDSEKYKTDADGVWKIEHWGRSLVEPSKEWFDKNRIGNEITPSQEELDNAAFEVKLIESLMGLGLL